MTASDYDLVDYPGVAAADTHPARTGAIGVLHGLDAAPAGRCRVLELGCGDGANLIPMAYALPDATFVGIDLSARAVARGSAMISELGLRNIQLHAADVRELPRAWGEFDYIIAHGLYSWVPEDVRARVLRICAEHLAPHGIAFISYLALPGNHLRQPLRELLLRFAGDGDPTARVARARQLAQLFTDAPPDGRAVSALMRELATELSALPDARIWHDWLAPINAAYHVAQFLAAAAPHGLQFLGEAEYFTTRYEHDARLSGARDALERAEADDVARKEELLDLLRVRRFRQTLLCRKDVTPSRPVPQRLASLAVATQLRPTGGAGAVAGPLEFRTPRGTTLAIDQPLAQIALLHLGAQWPRAVPFAELLELARARIRRHAAASAEVDAGILGSVLLDCFAANLVELYTSPPRLVTSAGERPRASAVARAEITRTSTVTTLRHTPLRIADPIGAELLRLLDGTHTRREIAAALGQVVAAHATRTRNVTDRVATSLEDLARAGLLEA